MVIITYIWLFFLILSVSFTIIAMIVEKNFDESHPVMKWWRRNVIAPYPYDEKDKDITE
jgi:hypothetical protein